MSRFSGPQGGAVKIGRNKGVMRMTRELKREEAEERNAKTPEDKRRKNRTND